MKNIKNLMKIIKFVLVGIMLSICLLGGHSSFNLKVLANNIGDTFQYLDLNYTITEVADDDNFGEVAVAYTYGLYYHVTIPSTVTYSPYTYTVTSIGTNAFNNNRNITGVTIPNGIKSIGSGAFMSCTGITGIDLPSSLEIIGGSAFAGSNLSAIVIPGSVTNIGTGAFRDTKLSTVNIPGNVERMDGSAFDLCDNLTEITVDSSNNFFSSIDGVLFSKDQTKLVRYPIDRGTSYTIPDVEIIGTSAFRETNFTELTIPASVTTIESHAFFDCQNLETVIFSDDGNLTTIESVVFGECSNLTDIVFPSTVTSIGYATFTNCVNLSIVVIPISVTNIPDALFAGCSTLTDMIIPVNVTNIGDAAFFNCVNLTDIIIPVNVTNIGDTAFSNCVNIDKLEFLGRTPPVIGTNVFYDVPSELKIYIPHGTYTVYRSVPELVPFSNIIERSWQECVDPSCDIPHVDTDNTHNSDLCDDPDCEICNSHDPDLCDDFDCEICNPGNGGKIPESNIDPQENLQNPPFFLQYIQPYIESFVPIPDTANSLSISDMYVFAESPSVIVNSDINITLVYTQNRGYIIRISVSLLRRLANLGDGLTIVIPNNFVSEIGVTEIILDNAAICAVVDTTGRTGYVTLTVDTVMHNKLTRVQRRQVEDNPVYEVTLYVERKDDYITDFKGGLLTLVFRRNVTMGDDNYNRTIFYRNSSGDIKRSSIGEYVRRRNGINHVIVFIFDEL